MVSAQLRFGLVLSGGIILPGLADYALSQAGYGTLGTLVWAVGYMGAMVYIWYRWLRPLDLTGP